MFICGFCKKSSKRGKKATRVVTEVRDATYPFIEAAHHFVRENRKVVKDDPGGHGVEIAKEMLACEKCVALSQSSI